jgi:vacuolar-type H+-ATPase subunit H
LQSAKSASTEQVTINTDAETILREANEKAQMILQKVREQAAYYKNEIIRISEINESREMKKKKLLSARESARQYFDEIIEKIKK